MSFDPNPYSASSTQPTTPKKSNVLTYLLIAGAVVLALCCGCGGVFAFLFNVGANQAAKLVRPQLQADPVIQQHIGDLETVEVSIGSLYSEIEKNQQRHQGRDMAFKVKGTKGEGVVMGHYEQQGQDSGHIYNGELIMPSGEFYPLSP